MKLRVGSRASKLAVVQAQIFMDAVRAWDPQIQLELITMKTTGDKILDRTLDQVGGKGLFVKELDLALLEGRVDVTVHSCKDLPMEENPALPLVAFSRREDPRDVLVLPPGETELDLSRPIGCASRRRTLQLAALWPQARVEPVRGNVQTRLGKLDAGQYGALVLAAAGLKRLGLAHRISRYFEPQELLPAAGQGVLAAQMRRGEAAPFLEGFAHGETALRVQAERAFVRALDGGCSSPVAAYAAVDGETLTLTGMNQWGVKGSIQGPPDAAAALGAALAEQLRGETR